MLVVDTNVLVYAADDAAPEQDRCRRQLETWRHGARPWHLTWNVVYEFLRVTTHPRVLHRPRVTSEAWSFVAALLASPSCSVLLPTGGHEVVLRSLLDEVGSSVRGNLHHDAHTVVVMREHGIRRIVTRDTDFHRFPGLEVIDPLTGGGW